MSVVHSFPKLYAIDKNGKIKVWTAAVLQSKGGSSSAATSRTTHGYIDGKQQTAYRDYNTGKNIGKSNETTPLAQCIAETQRKWTDKKEKEAYSETKPADCGEGYGDISGNGVGDGGGYGDGGDDGGGDGAAFTVGPFLRCSHKHSILLTLYRRRRRRRRRRVQERKRSSHSRVSSNPSWMDYDVYRMRHTLRASHSNHAPVRSLPVSPPSLPHSGLISRNTRISSSTASYTRTKCRLKNSQDSSKRRKSPMMTSNV